MTKPRTGQSGNWDRERADRLQKDVERMQKDIERLTAERDALAQIKRHIDEVRNGTGWTVQIYGVLLQQCDQYGKTIDTRRAERAEAERDALACICGTGGQDWSAACTRHGLSRGDWIQQALIADKAAADLRRENARLTEALYLTRITLEATFRVLQEASGLPDDIDDPDCRDEMVLALRPRAEKAEAENARLREGIERLCSDIDNPLRERHDESPHDLPEVAEDLRALLADTDSAQDEGGE